MQWRSFRYDPVSGVTLEISDEAAAELFRPEPGKAFWLISRNKNRITTAPVDGLSTPSDGAFSLVLKSGWNMIGNPFDFPVAWDSMFVDTLTMAEAEATVVEPPVGRNPSRDRYEFDVEILQPFDGYWVMNLSANDVVLRTPPTESAVASPPLSVTKTESDGGWIVDVRATSQGAEDAYNYIGVKPDARSLRDKHDRSEPPMSPGKSVSLYFPHLSWEVHGGKYTKDIRRTYEASNDASSFSGEGRGHVWRFDVAKNFANETAGDKVVLEFGGIDTVPSDANVYLVDRKLERRAELRDESRYAFFQGKRDFVHRDDDTRFVILVGDDDFITNHGDELPGLPGKTVLHQNYPNPFNPSTIIRYELARRGRVTLKIYDVTGALVKVLEDRAREPGRYEVGWSGENKRGEPVASGVYFYRLKTPDFSQTRKMLILK